MSRGGLPCLVLPVALHCAWGQLHAQMCSDKHACVHGCAPVLDLAFCLPTFPLNGLQGIDEAFDAAQEAIAVAERDLQDYLKEVRPCVRRRRRGGAWVAAMGAGAEEREDGAGASKTQCSKKHSTALCSPARRVMMTHACQHRRRQGPKHTQMGLQMAPSWHG